jgi:glycosyltransferase involved in cell wall biosynthesis
MNPLVTVGIPTYNNPEGLQKVLESIIHQTYKNVEIIISINPTPNPETNSKNIELCNTYQINNPRIRYTIHPTNIGADENFRYVRSKASGTYLLSAQDDDDWSNTYIENLVSALEQNPEIPLAACPTWYRLPNGNLSPVHLLNNLSVYNAVGNGDLGLATQGIWRRECMIEIPYTPNRVLGIEHVLASLILLKYGKILVVNSEWYIKGYTPGKFTDCFKYQPFYAFTSWWYMIATIAESDQIPTGKKLLLPIIAATNLVRAVGITGIQILVAMPDNPVKRLVQKRFFGAN